MTGEEIRAFCERWYAKGACPGCGAPLELVAGVGLRHWLPGQTIAYNGGIRVSYTGETMRAYGSGDQGDRRYCPWTADQLAALVHIGSGMVGVGGVTARPYL